jgi:hypothetical protein
VPELCLTCIYARRVAAAWYVQQGLREKREDWSGMSKSPVADVLGSYISACRLFSIVLFGGQFVADGPRKYSFKL